MNEKQLDLFQECSRELRIQIHQFASNIEKIRKVSGKFEDFEPRKEDAEEAKERERARMRAKLLYAQLLTNAGSNLARIHSANLQADPILREKYP